MRISKKCLMAFIIFCLFLIIISFGVIYPGIQKEMGFFLDAKLRAKYAGKVDFLIIGASHGLTSFVPQIIDQKLKVCSYNLSSTMLTTRSKFFLLEKELSRNPVKTVVLEVSFDSLSRNETEENAIGDANTVHRADSFQESLTFLFKNVKFNDWLNVYARIFMHGLSNTRDIFLNHEKNKIHYEEKGSHLLDSCDITLSQNDQKKLYKTLHIAKNCNLSTLERFCKIIDLCKKNNTRIIIVVVPISDGLIYQGDDWDSFRTFLRNFCIEKKLEYYDFNLIKKRYSLFSDSYSHHDADHMSRAGATSFSLLFCEILLKVAQGDEINSLFYSSYSEMQKDSPYCK